MASMKVYWFLGLAVGVLLGSQADGQMTDCINELTPAFACLDYVQGTAKAPSSECCTGLSSLVKTSPLCLCKLAEGRLNLSSAGVTVDLSKALQLPTVCKVKGADRNRCAVLLGPAAAPQGAAPGPGPAMQSGGVEPSTGGKVPDKGGSFQLVAPWISLVAGAVAAVALW